MKKDKLFFQIMKKIFLGHHKELRILILCETILTAISYAIVSGYQMFSNGHSSEYFMQEDGISKSFLSAGTILLFCGIILIITVLISYLGKRIPEYVFFTKNGNIKERFKNDGFIRGSNFVSGIHHSRIFRWKNIDRGIKDPYGSRFAYKF